MADNDDTEYSTRVWEDWDGDTPDSGTPLIAENFNHMEEGIYQAHRHIFLNGEGYLCVHLPHKVPRTDENELRYVVPEIAVKETSETDDASEGG